MNDISNYEDIEKLVELFYDKLLAEPITSPKFEHLNIKEHLPKIVDFWAFILIDKPGYTGNVFDKHLHLNLETKHFDKWIEFWISTVNELYSGPKAELACQRAQLLSYTFQPKLNQNNPNKII